MKYKTKETEEGRRKKKQGKHSGKYKKKEFKKQT